MLVFALRAMAAELLPEKVQPWVPWTAVLLGTTGAFILFPALGTAEDWNRRMVPMGNLVLGFLLPLLLCAAEWMFRKKGK